MIHYTVLFNYIFNPRHCLVGKCPLREERKEEYSLIQSIDPFIWDDPQTSLRLSLHNAKEASQGEGMTKQIDVHYAFDTLSSFGILKPIGFCGVQSSMFDCLLVKRKKFFSRWQKRWKFYNWKAPFVFIACGSLERMFFKHVKLRLCKWYLQVYDIWIKVKPVWSKYLCLEHERNKENRGKTITFRKTSAAQQPKQKDEKYRK